MPNTMHAICRDNYNFSKFYHHFHNEKVQLKDLNRFKDITTNYQALVFRNQRYCQHELTHSHLTKCLTQTAEQKKKKREGIHADLELEV